MDEQMADRLVAAVAGLLGGLLVWAAWREPSWWQELPRVRWVKRRWGAATARLVSAVLGLGLWALASVILSGWRMSW